MKCLTEMKQICVDYIIMTRVNTKVHKVKVTSSYAIFYFLSERPIKKIQLADVIYLGLRAVKV